MKITRKLVFLPLLVFLFPVVSMGETVDRKELVVRDNLYYKKFTDVPFTGTVTVKEQGELVEGKRVGVWLDFYLTGQLFSRVYFSNDGIRNGEYSKYHEVGCVMTKGNYVDGERDGWWFRYSKYCQLWVKGEYDNGKQIGEWIQYYDGEVIHTKGTYNKNGNKEGEWFVYSTDGTKVIGKVVYDDGEVLSRKGSILGLLDMDWRDQ